MANSYLIDLGLNDSTTDIVRKCNANFRQISRDLSSDTKGSVRREQERADDALDGAVTVINNTIEQVITEINNYVENVKSDLEDTIDDLKKKLEELGNDVNDRFDKIPDSSTSWKTIYPIGSIYLSFNSTSPETLFGGKWTKLKDVFLRASDDTNTGGEDSVTLSASNLPSHNHALNSSGYAAPLIDISNAAYSNTLMPFPPGSGTNETISMVRLGSSISMEMASRTTTTGANEAFNNMPKYQNVHAWRRTA